MQKLHLPLSDSKSEPGGKAPSILPSFDDLTVVTDPGSNKGWTYLLPGKAATMNGRQDTLSSVLC